jgi:hypothetical protein
MPSFFKTLLRMFAATPGAVATRPMAAVRRHFGSANRERAIVQPEAAIAAVRRARVSVVADERRTGLQPVAGSQVSAPSQTLPIVARALGPAVHTPSVHAASVHASGSLQSPLVAHGMQDPRRSGPCNAAPGGRRRRGRCRRRAVPRAVVAFLAAVDDAVAARLELAGGRAVVTAHDVEVVALLAHVDGAVAATLFAALVRAAVAVVRVAVVAFLVAGLRAVAAADRHVLVHVALQPSTFGGSHSSWHSTAPLPQLSVWHVAEQPSQAFASPTSHCSSGSTIESPQTLSRREQSP